MKKIEPGQLCMTRDKKELARAINIDPGVPLEMQEALRGNSPIWRCEALQHVEVQKLIYQSGTYMPVSNGTVIPGAHFWTRQSNLIPFEPPPKEDDVYRVEPRPDHVIEVGDVRIEIRVTEKEQA